jgi:hypothetical protein
MDGLSSVEVLLCALPSPRTSNLNAEATRKRLRDHLRNSNFTAKYWTWTREFPNGPFEDYLAVGIAVCVPAETMLIDLYRALRTWLDGNTGSRVEVTLGLRGYEITDMTEDQFLAMWRHASRTQ